QPLLNFLQRDFVLQRQIHRSNLDIASEILAAYGNGFPGWYDYVLLDYCGEFDVAIRSRVARN
ncbi:MAG: hypothetical protein AAGF33_17585, partial [Pseudomonadota bacterium]